MNNHKLLEKRKVFEDPKLIPLFYGEGDKGSTILVKWPTESQNWSTRLQTPSPTLFWTQNLVIYIWSFLKTVYGL